MSDDIHSVRKMWKYKSWKVVNDKNKCIMWWPNIVSKLRFLHRFWKIVSLLDLQQWLITNKGFGLLVEGVGECNETKINRFSKKDGVIFRGGPLSLGDLRICQMPKVLLSKQWGGQSSSNVLVGRSADCSATGGCDLHESHYPGATVTSQVNRPPTLTQKSVASLASRC